MSSRPLLFLVVETKVRELHAKSYFAWIAARNGFDVLMGAKTALWEQMDLEGHGIYVDKSVAITHREWSTFCRRRGNHMVSWDEEGLVFSDERIYRKLRIAPDVLMQTDRFFAWGQVQKDVIVKALPQAEDRIVLCGNPRFDLLRQDLRGFYKKESDALKARYGRMLLINTNFAFCNHFRKADEVQATLKVFPLSNEPGYIEGWVDLQRKAFEGFQKMLPLLTERFPHHTIVIRPHPSENHQVWRDFTHGLRGVEVNGDGNVHEWIMASEAVIHFNCTTAVESYLLGVPAISYLPVRSEVYENPLPNALSINVFDPMVLMERVALCLADPHHPDVWLWTEEREHLVRRYISGLEGSSSAERMVQELQVVASGIRRQRPLPERVLAVAKRAWRACRRLVVTPLDDNYVKHKMPGLAAAEIMAVLERLALATGQPCGCTVRQVAKNCHCITAIKQ
ncbi:MAG: hypothetical protein PHR77_03665 [Kiritimatiellae bacterium]|nr:hypothetical protein [Kiritimatiellia bacterium]MDD5522687.1 hypothetical protein [Kiritimatiellia bacterium]